MPDLSSTKMNADAFLAGAAGRGERLELHDGVVVARRPETIAHARAERQLRAALRNAILRAGSLCRVHHDGVSLRVDSRNVFQPDVIVTLGPAPPDAVEIADPVIVAEVLSPDTAAIDRGPKFVGYFRVPTIAHYLVVDPERRVAMHHARGRGASVDSQILGEGVIRFDPPKLVIAVAQIFTSP